MSILEKLRPVPRWKHADPAVRAAAVYDLGPDDAEVLYAIAREDVEARVRRAAVTRIDAVDVLAEIAGSDPDEDVRAEAIRGLAGIAAETDDAAQAIEAARRLLALGRTKEVVLVAREGSSAGIRAAIVDLIEDEKALAAVSRHAPDGATRVRALARMSQLTEVAAVALKAEHTDVAVAALERITDPQVLAEVAQRARNKVAARRARARLRPVSEPPPASDVQAMSPADRERASTLLHRVEALVALPDPDEAGRALGEVRLAWAELQADTEVDPLLLEPFEAACEAVREAMATRRQERAAEEERAQALAREQADRSAICGEIEALAPGSLDRIAELKVQWDSLPPMSSEYAASLTRRFQDACRAFEERERRLAMAAVAGSRLETLATELEQLAVSTQSPDEIVARWRGLRRDAELLREHAEANPSAAERVGASVARLEEIEHQHVEARSRRQQEQLRRVQQLCRHAEALAAAEHITLKAGRRALQDIRTVLEERPHLPSKRDWQEMQAKLEAARVAITPKVQELREADEWQRWANLQVQEELCREMEALKDDRDAERGLRRMRELQARWKQVALAPRAQGETMWRRFKAAQDEVFTRTAEQAAVQAEERKVNLARKLALCERVEALADSTDWVATAVQIQALQAEWKTIGAVPRGHEKAVWERFRAGCDRFFTRRQQDLKQRREGWASNLARKEALCATAEALAESTEWDATVVRVRQLQAEWKSIGPVRKSKSDVVWQRFRTACDRFFDRFKNRDRVDLASRVAPRETIVADLERLLPAEDAEAGPPPQGLFEAVQQARQRWHQAVELPRQVQQDLALRYHQALGRIMGAWPTAFLNTELDPEATRKRMEKLVARVEEYAAPAASQGTANLSPAEKLARQWRERLAANTIAGRHSGDTDDSRWRAAEQEVRNAQAQWMRLGPVPADIAGPLNERFQRACRTFFDQRRRAS